MRLRKPQTTILLVGDTHRPLEQERGLLSRREIHLLTASPDPEAINRVQRDAVDLVIIDSQPDDRCAIQLCLDLKSLPITEDIPVILLAAAEQRAEAERARPDIILYRPFADRALFEAVRRYTHVRGRRHQRFPANLRFIFSRGGETGQAFSRVLSSGGAFLKTDLPMPRGTRLGLRFRLPGGEAEIRCTGVVRSTEGLETEYEHAPGFGLEFEDLSEADRRRLEEFVDSRSGRLASR